MKYIIAGTAGHIDHGKTALVGALTGINTDRLEEEKRRGITIDIGFAHLQLTPEVRLGFVDVPGHERFVKNMLAGAGGIDLALLVVAADELIKPQTREHFDICRLLGVSKGGTALTKADLVEAETLELARLEIQEFGRGSFLEDAPIAAVSSVTGEGLDELRDALRRVSSAVTPKHATRHFRLPIDRSFAMRGFGTVVTGTLVSGSVEREQELEVHPTGRRVRIRGIEVYGDQAERAVAGQRTALNLADIDHQELHRGMVLTRPGLFRTTRVIDCRLDLLPSAKPLKNRAPIHFHSGTSEIEAEVRVLDGSGPLPPGATRFVRIVLREPALLLPDDRFIIRSFSPVVTIGGGVVIDNSGFRYTRETEPSLRLEILSAGAGGAAVRVRRLVAESHGGLGIAELVARTGLTEREIEDAASGLTIARSPEPWFLDPDWVSGQSVRLVASVGEFHRKNPMLSGCPKQTLLGRELAGIPAPVAGEILAGVQGLVIEGDIVRLESHTATLQSDEERAKDAIERAFDEAGLAVPGINEVLARSGVEPKRGRTLLQLLLRGQRLVRVTEDLIFHRSAIEQLKRSLESKRSQRFTVPEFKNWTGVSRKYAIPLLEFLDREHVTRRAGDDRIVL
jgi:selenocysteine-specific elongation factor